MKDASVDGCPFCLTNNQLRPKILYQDELWYFAELPEGSITNAGMAITKRHVETPFDINQAEWQQLHTLLPKFKSLLDTDNPTGYNIGWNVNATGGQNVAHAHLHLIARYDDEPLAGKGIRYAFKQESNRRTHKAD